MDEWFPSHYSVLLSGPPGVGKFEYIVTRLGRVLRAGGPAVFVTLDVHPEEIRARAKSLEVDLGMYEGPSFMFVDCYTPAAEMHSEAPTGRKSLVVSSFGNLEGIGMAVGKAALELGPPVHVFLYTISTLFLHNSTPAIAKFLQIVTARVKTNIGFILYAVNDGVHDDLTMNLLRSLTDGVIEMRFNDQMQREVRAHHMRGYRTDPTWTAFSIDPGSARVVA